MPYLELTCAGIVALYVAAKLATVGDRAGFLFRMSALVVAAWVGENSVIEAYDFYQYSASWSAFVGHVPIMIVLIWPVVIHSAWDLSRAVSPGQGCWVPVLAGTIVLADASLIEPIAVASGLWSWNEPGLFGVPLIGLLGWAIFAAVAVAALERARRGHHVLAMLVLAPGLTHVGLLVTWWCAFRWLRGELIEWPWVALAWTAATAISIVVIKSRIGARVPLREVLLRVPGAAFFFVLLAIHRPQVELIAYAVAFAPAYLALSATAERRAALGRR